MNTNKHKISVSPLKNFKKKFKEWEKMLYGKDRHSIRNQIYDMIWDSAVFQCINESRKYAAKDDKGEPKQNKMIHSFVNESFFKTQLLSIRRLTDKRSDVYSLYNLVENIKKNNTVLTRKNIIAARKVPYDYEKAQAKFDRTVDYTKGAVFVDPKIVLSESTHKQIDSLIGITADRRSPDDLIPYSIFKKLEDRLKKIEKLCKYVNKYIAHSATPKSRRGVSAQIKGALGKILDAHEIICKTANYIGFNLLSHSCGYFLATPQFDQFEFLDEPIASKETIEKLREFWKKCRTKTEQWV